MIVQIDYRHHGFGRSSGKLLPDTSLFLYMYVRKEAVLSSMIEGTQSSLSDLLLFEMDQEPGVPLDDVRGVSNYAAVLDHNLRLLNIALYTPKDLYPVGCFWCKYMISAFIMLPVSKFACEQEALKCGRN